VALARILSAAPFVPAAPTPMAAMIIAPPTTRIMVDTQRFDGLLKRATQS
jgi:hypothetical protein